MTDRKAFRDFPVDICSDEVKAYVGKKAGRLDLEKQAEIVSRIARPGYVIAWADCAVLDDRHVDIEGRVFESVLLADKLKNQKRVILFAVTAGNEIKECGEIENESVKDILSAAVLFCARRRMYSMLENEFGMKDLSALNPGSLPDWPIVNNHILCDIIGNVGEIGISLNEAGYMTPWNSGSGILFTGEAGYQNCSLCKNLDCIGRRAEFDQKEYDRLFG